MEINTIEMMEVFDTYEDKCVKTVNNIRNELLSIRAGRANPHILDKVLVDYYGTPSAIQAVANVSVPEARVIQIQPWEAKMIKEIEKAILASDIGLTPSNDGKIIRLVFPELTEDRRKELVKDIQKIAENSKVAVRSIRRDCIEKLKAMKKNSEITEDDLKDAEKEMQKITDSYTKEIETICDAKQKEIMSI